MRDNSAIIQTIGLKKYYNGESIKAIDNVDLSISRGEVVVIIGPSGSGKSTYLRSLNLLELPTDGSIIFNGVDIADKNVDINIHCQKMGRIADSLPSRTTQLSNLKLRDTPQQNAVLIRTVFILYDIAR